MSVADASDAVKQYQEQFLASMPYETIEASRFVEPVAFGFTAEQATAISELVLDRIKTATGSLLWSYQAERKVQPKAGDLWTVIDGNHKPVCVARTANVDIIPFDEVPEDYAQWGGEGDRTLASWRRMYWEYSLVECKRIGREPSDKAPMIMERFAVVYDRPFDASLKP